VSTYSLYLRSHHRMTEQSVHCKNSMPCLPWEALGRKVELFQHIKTDISFGWRVLKHIDTCRAQRFPSAVIKIIEHCHQNIHPAHTPSFHSYPEPFISSPLPPSHHLSPPKLSAWPHSEYSDPGQKQWFALLNWGEFTSPVHCVELIFVLHIRGKHKGSLLLEAMHTCHNLM